jgi:hypothetical protein
LLLTPNQTHSRNLQRICCFSPAGKYKVVMDSDAWHVGGQGRIHWDAEHFTTPAEEGKFNERDQYFQVRLDVTTCYNIFQMFELE